MSSQNRVIVTAGGAGIGRAIAEGFAESGAQVFVCDIAAAALEALKAAHPAIETAVVDIADPAAAAAFVADVVARAGGVDTLVNNAGIAGPTAALEEVADADWLRSFAVNIHGAFYMTREVTPHMKAAGGGAIINISTGSTQTCPVDRSPYIASKWALEGLTRAAARELGPSKIRVNAIRPGFVNSERMGAILGRKADERGVSLAALEAEFLQYISMRTKVEPSDIGAMAVFLASPAARHVSGQIISVDGNIEWE